MTGRRVKLESWASVIAARERAGQLPPDMRPVHLMRNGEPVLARCVQCGKIRRLTIAQVHDATLRFCPASCGGALEILNQGE